MTTPTLTTSLSVLVVGGTLHIGPHSVKRTLRRGCDLVTFDDLSVSCPFTLQKREIRLLDVLDSGAAHTSGCLKTSKKCSNTDYRAAFS